MEVDVPPSLYAMAIVELACLSRKSDGHLVFFAETSRMVFMLCLNYIMTCFFIAQLGKMVIEQFELGERECNLDFMVLIFSCVFIFEVSMMQHLEKCIRLIKLLVFAESRGQQSYVRVADVAATATRAATSVVERKGSAEGVILVRQKSMSTRVQKLLRHPLFDRDDQHGIKRWTLHETTPFYRIMCFLLIITPKLCADLMLAYLGGLYIGSTEEGSEMLLNTLAVVFIAEIDELLYSAFTSAAMRYNLENMKEVKFAQTNTVRVGMWLFHSFVTPSISILFSLYITSHVSGCTLVGLGDMQFLRLVSFFPRRAD